MQDQADPPATPEAPALTRFNPGSRRHVRSARPWDRLAYIVDVLPAAIEQLAPALGTGPTARVLDYGCADVPYRHLFGPSVEYVAADLPGNPHANAELRPDGSVAAADESFDAVISTQVLEHVSDPALYLSECARVLRPGGRLLLSTHGIMVYHPDPDDFWRWTCAGLQRQVRDAGFEIRQFEGVMGLAATGLQLLQDALYWRLPRPFRAPAALAFQALIRVADRVERPSDRRLNSLVFALVAERS